MPGLDTLLIITALSFQNFREWQVYDRPDAVRGGLAFVVGFLPRPLTAVSAAAPSLADFGGTLGVDISASPPVGSHPWGLSPRTREPLQRHPSTRYPPYPDHFLSGCSYDSARVPELELWSLLDLATASPSSKCSRYSAIASAVDRKKTTRPPLILEDSGMYNIHSSGAGLLRKGRQDNPKTCTDQGRAVCKVLAHLVRNL